MSWTDLSGCAGFTWGHISNMTPVRADGMISGRTPLVFLPGMLCDGRLWSAQIAALGIGRPTRVADLTGADSIEGLANNVLTWLPERSVLVALSMGGYVALEIARRMFASAVSQRLEALVLIATSARPDTVTQRSLRQQLLDLARKGTFQGVTPRLLPTLIHHARIGEETLTETIFAMAADVGRNGFIRQQTAVLHRHDQRMTLSNIDCPTLILCGDHDQRTPPDCSEEMQRLIPNAHFHLLADCGHLPSLELPDKVNAHIASFLQSAGPVRPFKPLSH